jgi:hypothetical protein
MGLVFIKKKMRKRSKDIIVVVSALKLIVWNVLTIKCSNPSQLTIIFKS